MHTRSSVRLSLDLGENQKDPGEFRDCVALADSLGFDTAWLGDHFMPWFHSSNRSAYVWPLMGASLERTNKIRVGPYVTTPIGARYHPAIVAQACATLDNMYPGRFRVGVGTGEAMNEAQFLTSWPNWQERMDRLVEGVQLMRKLWTSSSYFDFDGKFFKMKQVYLYTKPKTELKVYFSGVGAKSAFYAGRAGDGLITLSANNSYERCKNIIFPSFEGGAREAGKNPEVLERIVSLSFTLENKDSFLKSARQSAGIIAKGSWNEPDPRKLEAMGETVTEDELLGSTYFCSNWNDLIDIISKFHEIGTTEVSLYSGPDQETIRTYAKKLLDHFETTKIQQNS